ncbi:MAG: PDZ domain-containing protein [Candidatus Riflebacteria bacterium]|nr:PDZ domain-containing protein [Candidatus Riflebacteria bacterium]
MKSPIEPSFAFRAERRPGVLAAASKLLLASKVGLVALVLTLGVARVQTVGQETPPSGAGGAPAAESSAPGPSDSSAILESNLFGVQLEKPPPPPPPAPVAAPPPVAPPPKPTAPEEKPPFKLVGTLAGVGDWSMAFLEKGTLQDAVRIGDTWEQATVLNVQRNRATIRWKNKTLNLEVEFKDWAGKSAQVAALAPPPVEPAAPPGPVYTQQGEVPMPESIETRKVPRAQVDRNLQDLAGLLASMRIQPYYDAGQPSGFLLTNIRPGSFIDQVGVQNGDILRFVNGQKIDNVQNAFQLYNIFKNSTNVEVTVVRDTRPVTLKYNIE